MCALFGRCPVAAPAALRHSLSTHTTTGSYHAGPPRWLCFSAALGREAGGGHLRVLADSRDSGCRLAPGRRLLTPSVLIPSLWPRQGPGWHQEWRGRPLQLGCLEVCPSKVITHLGQRQEAGFPRAHTASQCLTGTGWVCSFFIPMSRSVHVPVPAP